MTGERMKERVKQESIKMQDPQKSLERILSAEIDIATKLPHARVW
jgi:hypothetical protein